MITCNGRAVWVVAAALALAACQSTPKREPAPTPAPVATPPKSGGGYDPLTQAPAPITAQQRKEAGVDFRPEPKKPEDGEN